ncbi:hypothetical protein [Vibrio sonorensis]|uniref:hypothetical protein n=1 Tax=Vibrio sonorensis TaxID=1004316 RepID=UPI0008DB029B|nr:hypothetical protein [Vibrio sonorensis]
MKKLITPLLLLSSFSSFANTVYVSPDLRVGPYFGSGISGGGLHLGLTNTLGLDAVYLSYSHISAEYITDRDRLKTYRLGTQYNFESAPDIGVQFEMGVVDYQGTRTILSNTRERDGTGISGAFAWTLNVSDQLGFRAGMDLNYIDRHKTFLSSHLSTSLNLGVTLRF